MRVIIRPDIHRGETPRVTGSRAGPWPCVAGVRPGTPVRFGLRSTRYYTCRSERPQSDNPTTRRAPTSGSRPPTSDFWQLPTINQ